MKLQKTVPPKVLYSAHQEQEGKSLTERLYIKKRFEFEYFDT